MTTPVASVEATELDRARGALRATLTAALTEDESLGDVDMAAIPVTITAPYARECRLIAETVASAHHVLVTGTPRHGGYSKGADATFWGAATQVTDAVAHYQRVIEHALAAARAAQPPTGKDPATHRISFLLGYRLGLTSPGLDPDAVAAQVATPGATGVRLRSTGSGSWAGYQFAQTTLLAVA